MSGIPNSISDGIIKWEPYAGGDILCKRFSFDDWHKMVSDIHSDQEWEIFICEHNSFIHCFVLKRCIDNSPIAFVYTLKEYDDKKTISIHGGGWEDPILYYRGYILILKTLLESGYKIRTYCSRDNLKAIRLSKGIGYVIYKTDSSTVYMWLSLYNLKRSRVYKHFY